MAFGVVATPSIVDPHVVTDGPAQLLQPLMESCEARLSFSIIGGGIHEHADPARPLRLLRVCREGPRGSAAERGNELSSSDVDWHVTLPWGSCPCNRGKISRFDDGVSVGSSATGRYASGGRAMSASPQKRTNSRCLDLSLCQKQSFTGLRKKVGAHPPCALPSSF